jgi:hypothetical protein
VNSRDPHSLPPDDVQEWIAQNAAQLREALSKPETQARIIDLLTGEAERRQRRLDQLACELDGMEITM